MKKTDLDKKLNKKQTTIAVTAVAVFVLLGILAAILGNVFYLKNQEAKIVNYSSSSDSPLRLRNNGALVYVYKEPTAFSLNDALELSKGATMVVVRAESIPDKTALPAKAEIDPSATPHAMVFLQVKSRSGQKTTDYVLEIVSQNEYEPDEALPPLIEEGKDDTSNLLK